MNQKQFKIVKKLDRKAQTHWQIALVCFGVFVFVKMFATISLSMGAIGSAITYSFIGTLAGLCGFLTLLEGNHSDTTSKLAEIYYNIKNGRKPRTTKGRK